MIPSEKLTHPSPLVSVIMPAHNREHSLSESIQSVINQTYQHWELLVIDDRSTDGTARVVQSLANTDERIRYLKNENKQGPAGARNWGITHANGSYISFLDSDDLWLPHHLNECLSVLTVEDKKFCSAKWYEKKGTEITPSGFVGCVDYLMKTFSENKGNSNNYVFGPEIFEYLIVRDFYPFHISTVVVHKEVLERVCLFNEKLFGPEDSDLLFKIVLEYGLCIINNFHSIWVQGEDNIHFFKNSTQDFEKQTLPKVLKNRLNHLSFFKEQIRLIRANRHKLSDANRLIHLKRFEIAFNCFYLRHTKSEWLSH